jgi:hypothetical protein
MSTPNQEQVVNQINSEITSIKDVMKDPKITDYAFQKLSENAKLLQTKLDKILKGGSRVNQRDLDDAYTTMQEVKRKELGKMGTNAILRVVIGISVIVLAYVIINKYTKNK